MTRQRGRGEDPLRVYVLGMVLALYVGFARLNHIRFVAQDPMLILKVSELPGQSTFWRFLASLNLNVAWQLLQLQRILRERVWEAANVRLKSITLDTDTTVHTVYGKQMGARKGYNPKNKGKKSFQSILTFLAETREYVWGELRNGDRPDGKQIAPFCKVSSPPYPAAFRPSSRGPMPLSIVGRRCKPTKKPRRTSSSWRARRHVCWNSCKPLTGSPRATRTPMNSANSGISRKVGARRTALSLCAMRKRTLKSASSINSSTLRVTGFCLCRLGSKEPFGKNKSMTSAGEPREDLLRIATCDCFLIDVGSER